MMVRRMCALAFAATLIAGAAAIPASAAPLERGKFHNTVSEVIEECDLIVQHDVDVKGSFLVNARGRDGLVYFMDVSRGTESWTNLATGKSYSSTFAVLLKDHTVTDNGDGTLTILVIGTGNEKWYGPDGKLLFRNPGQVRFEVLIDHGGTPVDPSDDEFVEFLGFVKGSTGLNETEGRDFCEDLHEFTS